MRSTHRKFWQYQEDDGTMSRFRVRWFVWTTLGMAALGSLALLLSGWQAWPVPLVTGACGAGGTLIAFLVDYVSDKKELDK